MKNVSVLLLPIILILLNGCSQKAKVVSSWVDPSLNDYTATNILVMGISRDETSLKLYENVFVEQLTKFDVQAMASHKKIGSLPEPNQKIVEKAIKRTGASSVIITRVVDSKTETRTSPGTIHFAPGGYYGGLYGYFNAVYTPPTNIQRTTVRLESNLYDVETAKLVWSAQSETIDFKLLKTDFERLVHILMGDMKKAGVL